MADGKLPNLELDFGALVLERGGEEVADEGAGIEGDDDGDNDDDDDDGEEEESEDDLVAHSDEDGEDAQLVGGWSVGGTEGRRRDQPKYVGAEGRAQFFEMYRADVHLRNRALSSPRSAHLRKAAELQRAPLPLGVCRDAAEIDLAGRSMGPSFARVLAASLPQVLADPSIQVLTLRDNRLDGAAGKALLDALLRVEGGACFVSTLDLSCNPLLFAHPTLGGSSAAALARTRQLLEQPPDARDVGRPETAPTRTRRGKLLQRFAEAVAPEHVHASLRELLLAPSQRCLQTLSLERTRLGDAGAAALCDALASCATLRTLDLSDNGIGLKGARDGARGLRALLAAGGGKAPYNTSKITALGLAWNHLCGEAAIDVAEGLAANATLEVLDLAWNNFGRRDREHLGGAAGEAGGEEGAGAGATAAAAAGGEEAAAAGGGAAVGHAAEYTGAAAALAAALGAKECALRHADLSCNRLGVAACALLSAGLSGNRRLAGLHLDGNDCVLDARGFVHPCVQATHLASVDHTAHARILDPHLQAGGGRAAAQRARRTPTHAGMCWICDRWDEHRFELAVPAPPGLGSSSGGGGGSVPNGARFQFVDPPQPTAAAAAAAAAATAAVTMRHHLGGGAGAAAAADGGRQQQQQQQQQQQPPAVLHNLMLHLSTDDFRGEPMIRLDDGKKGEKGKGWRFVLPRMLPPGNVRFFYSTRLPRHTAAAAAAAGGGSGGAAPGDLEEGRRMLVGLEDGEGGLIGEDGAKRGQKKKKKAAAAAAAAEQPSSGAGGQRRASMGSIERHAITLVDTTHSPRKATRNAVQASRDAQVAAEAHLAEDTWLAGARAATDEGAAAVEVAEAAAAATAAAATAAEDAEAAPAAGTDEAGGAPLGEEAAAAVAATPEQRAAANKAAADQASLALFFEESEERRLRQLRLYETPLDCCSALPQQIAPERLPTLPTPTDGSKAEVVAQDAAKSAARALLLAAAPPVHQAAPMCGGVARVPLRLDSPDRRRWLRRLAASEELEALAAAGHGWVRGGLAGGAADEEVAAKIKAANEALEDEPVPTEGEAAAAQLAARQALEGGSTGRALPAIMNRMAMAPDEEFECEQALPRITHDGSAAAPMTTLPPKPRWALPHSVFRPRQHEADSGDFWEHEGTLLGAFECDWRRAKVASSVLKKDLADCAAVKAMLRSLYPAVLAAFGHFACLSPSDPFSLSLNGFREAMSQFGVPDAESVHCTAERLDLAFVQANVELTAAAKRLDNPDKSLTRFEWLEILVRAAIAKFVAGGAAAGSSSSSRSSSSSSSPTPVADAVERLFLEHVIPHLRKEGVLSRYADTSRGEGVDPFQLGRLPVDEWRTDRLYNEDIHVVFKSYGAKLRALFSKYANLYEVSDGYSAPQCSTMGLREYVQLLDDKGLIGKALPKRDAVETFLLAKMLYMDPLLPHRHTGAKKQPLPQRLLTYTDFLEALARVADMRHRGGGCYGPWGGEEGDPVPLAELVRKLIKQYVFKSFGGMLRAAKRKAAAAVAFANAPTKLAELMAAKQASSS